MHSYPDQYVCALSTETFYLYSRLLVQTFSLELQRELDPATLGPTTC